MITMILFLQLFYFLIRFFVYSFSYPHLIGFFLTSGVLVFCYTSLNDFAKPSQGFGGEQVSDIKQAGLSEYFFDVIYITWGVLVTSLISDWFWLFYLTIPAYAGWKLWDLIIKPYVFAPSMSGDSSNDDDEKRRKKKEKKQMKTKVVRR
eukprot:TRINITY_DN953_c0_g1_i2.p1 TRINITY_DN953_c0_g1~~TRINITY_DN953_c0_g1_i2.p1  ORF type:complete len:149 (-),score=23.19 TRINITY_DN953_c0_g1_i2:38-484(-)